MYTLEFILISIIHSISIYGVPVSVSDTQRWKMWSHAPDTHNLRCKRKGDREKVGGDHLEITMPFLEWGEKSALLVWFPSLVMLLLIWVLLFLCHFSICSLLSLFSDCFNPCPPCCSCELLTLIVPQKNLSYWAENLHVFQGKCCENCM